MNISFLIFDKLL